MKKSSVIIIIVAIAAIAGLTLAWLKTNQPKPKPDTQPQLTEAQKFKQEYSEVADNHVFRYKNLEQILKILESGTGVVYLGFPECPWCQKYVKYLDEVAREMKLSEVSYYNIRQIRKDDTPEYKRIVEILKNHGLDKDNKGNPRVFVPEVVAVKDGHVVARDNTTSLNSSEKDGTPAEWWTEERVDRIKGILKELIIQQACTGICN